MTQADLVTQCPACATSFRITPEQIEMAAGAVRCGACLQIFQAGDHMLSRVQEDESEKRLIQADPMIIEGFWENWEIYVSSAFSSSTVPRSASSKTNLPSSFTYPSEDGERWVDERNENQAEDEDAQVRLINIRTDPDDLVGDYQESPATNPTWIAGVLLMVLLVAVQMLWSYRDKIAQIPEYRPWFADFCQATGCAVEPYSDINLLSTTNLVIRSHDSVKKALVIDAILRNSAEFRQKFPVLHLQFRNVKNTVVASRRFRPEEYLAGELKGMQLIPGNTEVRFSLEIVDPGENALGYNIEILRPD